MGALARLNRCVANISDTVRVLAIIGFLFCMLGITVQPDLRITFELVMAGAAIASCIVLLAHHLREEASTAIYFGAVILLLTSGDITNWVGRTLCLMFGFLCCWLMLYLMPPRAQNSGE